MAHKRIMLLLRVLYITLLCSCWPIAASSYPGVSRKMKRQDIQATKNCTELRSVTQGPYWLEENIEASNIRGNLSYGVPLNVTFRVVDGQRSSHSNKCEPLALARVDLWQCRYDGRYSDEDLEHTEGETWLRGYQYTNSTGYALFHSIYPGWYKSRTVHIHVRLRLYNEDNTTSYDETSQLFFDDAISEAIFHNVYPYNDRGSQTRDTFNSNDTLFVESNVISLAGDYSNPEGYIGLVEFKLPLVSYTEEVQENLLLSEK